MPWHFSRGGTGLGQGQRGGAGLRTQGLAAENLPPGGREMSTHQRRIGRAGALLWMAPGHLPQVQRGSEDGLTSPQQKGLPRERVGAWP